MRKSASRHGAVLIVVLGILVVLTLLATTFATLQAMERQISRNYLDEVRAKLIAESGVEYALAQIQSSAEQGRLGDPAALYWGDNTAEKGDPDANRPLEKAKNPSYAWENETIQNPTDARVEPLLLTVDGRRIGISGKMGSGTYGANGDVYRLRVEDANGKIFLNDGIEGGPGGSVTQNLKRILNNLGTVVGTPGVGDKIVGRRPATGWRAKQELLGVLGRSEYDKIRSFVTTNAWVDHDVVNPVPLSAEVAGRPDLYPVPYNQEIGTYRYGRSKSSAGVPVTIPLLLAPEFPAPPGTLGHAAMAMDELNAQWIERTSRAPVNVNGASKEVLTALIMGLRGWFVVERRKSNPGPGELYNLLDYAGPFDNTPGGKHGDEFGYLYSTAPFHGPGATVTGGVDAAKVADEILACRSRAKSPHCAGADYAAAWYGGVFRTWRQFYAFCDGLVTGGLLVDSRPGIFKDFVLNPSETLDAGSDALAPADSPGQAHFASRALADVLKANFNPNCALNELNPDANLFLIVDKTDLMANSTEFCFTPMGVYEIESEGLVIRPSSGGDLLKVARGEVVARKKVVATVKVFDAYRETSQADFYEGHAGDRPSFAPVTNNNKTMELGPEPDNGPAAAECRWSGWIQLSTVGGHWTGTAERHAPQALDVTPVGNAELGSALHGHFSLDHRLHHHAAGPGSCAPLASTPMLKNQPDGQGAWGEASAGPYGPAVGAPGRYRLARDWHASRPPASPTYAAVSDLRIDGAYVERDSAPLFVLTPDVLGITNTVTLWIKPAYFPEMTGKPRTYFSLDRLKELPEWRWQMINAIWFFPSHDVPAFQASPNEFKPPVYKPGPWRPSSMGCGYSTWINPGQWGPNGGGVGKITPSLNHRAHPAPDSDQPDLLRAHGWTHVAYQWRYGTNRSFTATDTALWINGQPVPQTGDIRAHPQYFTLADVISPENAFRLGEPSTTAKFPPRNPANGAQVKYSRNWAADSTIDEFYVFRREALGDAQDLFSLGRYYRPKRGLEASFTSRRLSLSGSGATGRALPPASGRTTTASSTPPSVKIMAVAWTWHPEKHLLDHPSLPDGTPAVRDHNLDLDLKADVEISILLNGLPAASALQDDGGSAVGTLFVTSGDDLRYCVRVRVPESDLNTILLATPVIDDVTIYYMTDAEYLAYHLDGGTR